MVEPVYVTMSNYFYCRYRKLSAKIHPDKLRDVEEPRLAFEEVDIIIFISSCTVLNMS